MVESENGSGSSGIALGRNRHWMPTSLRRPFLFTVAAFLLLMGVSIELLRQYSNRHHGLIHLKSYEDLGRLTSGVYTYVPTAFAVLVVALWNICTLDVLRLEPFFQLANPRGAPGTVLFTNYSFFYGIVTPIMAARNRHWIVACVSTIALVLRMMLPSLLSGLVYLDEPTMVVVRHLNTWPSLVNLETQSSWLNNAASHSRNRTDIFEETFFFYQTPDYALPPISRPVHANRGASTWELTQNVHWANLSCVEVSVDDIIPTKWIGSNSTGTALAWDIRNVLFQNASDTSADSNCQIDITLNSTYPTGNGLSQIRHWEPLNPNPNAEDTATLNRTGCESFSLMGLTIDVDATSKDLASKATVFGCTAAYWRAEADITLPTNSSIADVTNVSNMTTTLTPADLSISSFQNLLFTKYLQIDLTLWNNGLSISLAGSTGVNRTLIRSDPNRINITQYEQAVAQLWNRQFVGSMNKFFNTTTGPTRVQAKQSTDTIIYSVASHSALVAEGLLLSAFLLLLVMALIYPLRPNFLLSDPGSIAAQCALITDTFSSLNRLMHSDVDYYRATPRQLRRFARTLRCIWVDGPDGKRIDIIPREGHTAAPNPGASRARRRARLNARPHFLTPPWFLVECVLMAGVLGAFGVSFQFIRLDKFDTSDSAGTMTVALFLIYGPTVIASMISSLFVSVHRHIGNMEPWVQLQEGMALAKHSLTVKYGSHTPVTAWKQFRENRPPLLVALSAVCILDFVLTIVSSGLFEPSVDRWTEHTDVIAAQYNDSRFFNPEVRAVFNGYSLISDGLFTGNSLLSWNTASFSFYPLGINDPDAQYNDWTMYTARTRGIGVELQCGEVSPSQSRYDSLSDSSYWTYTPFEAATGTNCTAEMQRPTENTQSGSLYFSASMNTSLACQTSFVVSRYGDINGTNIIYGAETNSSVFHCSPKVIIEDFEMEFDPNGLVFGYQPIPGSSVTSGPMFQNVSSGLVLFNQAFIRHGEVDQSWPALLTTQVYDRLIANHTSHNHTWSNHKFRHHSHPHPNTEAQEQALLIHTLQTVYRATFTTYTTLQRDLYLSPLALSQNANTTIPSTVMSAVWDITPSNTTIVIIIILLSIDLFVLVGVFWLRHKHYAGAPVPHSIGSLVPWVAHSRMLNDIRGTGNWSEQKRKEHLERLGYRYRFGEWGGADGPVALDYDEKPLIEEERHEMDEIELTRSIKREESGTDPPEEPHDRE
ncbi:uncharacterized protein N7498_000740 [Penicillium cinerascens]|uniref:Uncharacterized protein n=1 Tax=Penicillium cinerascens TaxID=70096 RepID=A0A9W9NEX4_9EURO|nr:uncharacterized protein N7498_000740 [Penicillium cinerascens]KAJ5218641.1 hypothetical protein N7498_000740 [Penicillium cinerascens]